MPKPTVRTTKQVTFTCADIRDLLIRESGMPASSSLSIDYRDGDHSEDLQITLIHVEVPKT